MMIKRIWLLGVLTSLVSAPEVFCQTIDEASGFFIKGEMDSAVIIARNEISKDTTNSLAYFIAGRALNAKGSYAEATEYLEKLLTFEDIPKYSRAWALCDLGSCYYAKGEYGKARESLKKCLALNATKNVNNTAGSRLMRYGLDNFYNNWIRKESFHFIFHFQDSAAVENMSLFIKKKEAAFDSINGFFRAVLPKKIDYFVWSKADVAENFFRRPLAFTEGDLCVTHTEKRNSVGHEMTHSISYFAAPAGLTRELISEGTSVCFDLSGKNNLEKLKGKNIDADSIVAIWKSKKRTREDILYPLGGELVKRLIADFGREKFILLLAEQSYENAKRIYGTQLDGTLYKLAEDIRQL